MKLLSRIPAKPGTGFRPFPDADIAQSIPQRFAQQVRAHGARPAVKWDGGSYSYDELDATANRLARTLLARRGKDAEPIALLFDHGGEALAAILAVLKAGKFYVVLDPGYPPDRLEYMLADSGARLMVTDARNREYARQLCGSTIALVPFDDVDPQLPASDVDAAPAPDDLAMLLYTSGSTGRPKGVMHTHRTVLVDVRNHTNLWSIDARDRWLLYTSISFANSVRTIYGALMNGASICLYDVKARGFGGMARWLQDNRVTIVRAIPTSFRSFMETLEDGVAFPCVRVLSVGGEPMLQGDVAHFNRRFMPHCVLSHNFGPTECLTVCWALIPHGTQVACGKLPIGYSLPDKDVVLLDEARREVAEGEEGEIAVRSRYISPGYWRADERTAAAFLPDPAGGDARIYLTGDLGRRQPDGTLVHVGRRDFQVKIRGYRVDVAEIENALRAVAGVGDAVVVGREWAPGEQRLVAYYVATTEPAVAGSAIRVGLAQTLPDYMIPSVFVAMRALPRTPSGKTDRLQLPLPERRRRDLETPRVAPGSAIEIELAAIWAEVLDLEQVGTEDRFLDLGGDSLLAARIASRVAARFNLGFAADILRESSTIARMAHALAAALRDDGRHDAGLTTPDRVSRRARRPKIDSTNAAD